MERTALQRCENAALGQEHDDQDACQCSHYRMKTYAFNYVMDRLKSIMWGSS